MSGDFLARWSRRKREAAQPAQGSVKESVTESVAPPAEPELPPEELAKLPSLDALTPETDLTPFLRAGVPKLLRNAALRRMWSLDPAIRDFVSEAREYAWDWNTPGAVPGAGPLLSVDKVDEMVERIFGEGRTSVESPTAASRGAAVSEPAEARVEGPAVGAVPSPKADAGVGEAPAVPVMPTELLPELPPEPAGTAPEATEKAAKPARTRRHGGAMPL